MDHPETPDELEFVDGTDDCYTPEALQWLRAQALGQFALPELAEPTSAPEAPGPDPDHGREVDADAGVDSGADAGVDSGPSTEGVGGDVAIEPWLTPRPAARGPKLCGPGSRRGRRLLKPDADRRGQLTPEQRLLILDAWLRSGLPAKDFAGLVGLSKHTLYAWKQKFAEHGPEGLVDRKRGGPCGSRLPELTKRAILMLKAAQPDAGCQRISDLLARGPALPASPNAVAKVLKEAGYTFHEAPTKRHPDRPRHFERARPNQLWQTDLFSFMLKRQNRRVHLVAFLDDHSRYITCWGLSGSQSAGFVLDTLRDGLASYPPPQEILTDNGAQYVTWRGVSQFAKELRKRGIAHVVAKPRRPQTLGKTERFWGTLWRECVEAAVFLDLDDARTRIGHFIDHYNFRRTHRGIDGLYPADRYFETADAVRRSMEHRVADNALELARHGIPKRPFYLSGQTGDGHPFSVHTEGERLFMIDAQGQRHELDPDAPLPVEARADVAAVESAPGHSDLDAPLADVATAFAPPLPIRPGVAPPGAPAEDDDGDEYADDAPPWHLGPDGELAFGPDDDFDPTARDADVDDAEVTDAP